jgi:glucokinase
MPADIVAIDLGGTHLRVALFDGTSPTPLSSTKLETQADQGPDHVLDRVVEAVGQLPPPQGERCFGVGAPGPLDPVAGVVFEAPNLPGWKNLPLKAKLTNRLGWPVVIGNDANMAALGEWQHGAGRGTTNLIYLTISTGVGGGVITNGELLLGHRGLAAELGHLTVQPDGPRCGCGQRGHLEAVASGTAIARAARQRIDDGEDSALAGLDEPLTAELVGRAAQAGDELAAAVIREAAEWLGLALASFAHLFNPEVFVLGGGVSQLGALLFDPIQQSLQNNIMDPSYLDGLQILPAALGDDAGLVGAMVLASQAHA